MPEIPEPHQPDLSAVMDALEDHVALVDRDGRVRHVNAAWRAFARRNAWAGATWEGADYLAACVAGGEDGRAVAAALRAVLSGRLPEFEFEYACHAPDELRWFSLRIAGLGGLADGAVLNHRDVTGAHLDRLERDRAAGTPGTGPRPAPERAGRRALQEHAEQLVVVDRRIGVLHLELPAEAADGPGEDHVREALGVLEQVFLPPHRSGRLSTRGLLVLLLGLEPEQLERVAAVALCALRVRLPHAVVDGATVRVGPLRTDLPADQALERLARDLAPWRPGPGPALVLPTVPGSPPGAGAVPA